MQEEPSKLSKGGSMLRTLARKGTVTVLERPGKMTAVAIERSAGGIVNLEGWAESSQLLKELYALVKHWPDIR